MCIAPMTGLLRVGRLEEYNDDALCIAPAADDQDAYTFVDHREDPVAIIGYVARRLVPEHMLMARVDEDLEHLFANYRGQEHRIPLTLCWHDQYVVISSLAELLKDGYRFFV